MKPIQETFSPKWKRMMLENAISNLFHSKWNCNKTRGGGGGELLHIFSLQVEGSKIAFYENYFSGNYFYFLLFLFSSPHSPSYIIMYHYKQGLILTPCLFFSFVVLGNIGHWFSMNTYCKNMLQNQCRTMK